MSAHNNAEVTPVVQSPVQAFLETTSVKGIPKACRASTRCVRILWIIAVFFGTGVSVYFLYNLCSIYASKDSFLKQHFQPLKPSDVPEVTVCNLNPFANTPENLKNELDRVMDNLLGVRHLFLQFPEYFKEKERHIYGKLFHPGKLFEMSLSEDLPEHGWNETR